MEGMDCKKARPALQRFADGELVREEAARVRAHLMDCLSCRSIVGEVYGLRRFFQEEEEPVRPSEGFARRVAALAFSGPAFDREESTLLPFVKTLAAVAAGVLLLAGALWIRPAAWSRGGGIEVEAGVRGPSVDERLRLLREERERQGAPGSTSGSGRSPRKP